MTNTNNVQNLINEVMATRGATVSIFGQPTTLNEEVSTGLVDIIEILESFKGYEADTVINAQYEVVYMADSEDYAIVDSSETIVGDNIIEGGFEDEEEAEERMYELQERDASPVSAGEFLDYLEELGYIEEKRADNSYNWSANVSNDYNFRIYESTTDDKFYVEFKVHLFGDVRANYTDSVVLEFEDDYTFFEALHEADGYEEYKGYGIRFSATHEAYEIWNLETDHSTDDKYAWEDVIEHIDELAAEEA